jgi:hypothetical protein
MGELLAGPPANDWRPAPARACPHCGHLPKDFIDEETAVE